MDATSSRRTPCEVTQASQVRESDDVQAWGIEYSETLIRWKYTSVLWGFEPRIDYTSNVNTRLQPWCTSGRYFSVRYDPSDKPLQRPYFLVTLAEGCFRQETHIVLPRSYHKQIHVEPEPWGHYMKAMQVVGYREGIAILQINCVDSCMEFLVVHMKTGAVLAKRREPVTRQHYLCDCIISPDLSHFIIKPNAMYVLNFCRRSEYHNTMLLVCCRDGGDDGTTVKNLFEGAAVRQFVLFDPRYAHRRIAIGNYVCDGRDVLAIYDIVDEAVVATSDASSLYQTTHNIAWSPDGTYVASLTLGRSVKDGLFNFPRVLIYASDDLRVLHAVRTSLLAEVPTLSPAAIFPVFSETGTHLAVAYGEQDSFYQQVAGVNVHKVPLHVNLQSLCRLTIRVFFDRQDVERLPLPTKLKAYLRFQPCYE